MGKKRKGPGKKKKAVARIISASDSDVEDNPQPTLPSPRLTSPGCTCFQNISLNKGKYVPKTCALHAPLEFTENRPTIYERIEELQKNDIDDVDELRPGSVKPVTIPYDMAKEMLEQYSLLLLRLEGENGKHDDMAEIFVRRATLYSCMGDHRAAFLDSKKAVSMRPSYTPAAFRAGHAAFKLGNFVEAIQMFQHGLKMSRENVYLNRAYQCAVKHCIKALKTNKLPEYEGQMKIYNEYVEWQRKYQIVQDQINNEIAAGKKPTVSLPTKPRKFEGYEDLIDTLIKAVQIDDEVIDVPQVPKDRKTNEMEPEESAPVK
eukprot:g14459.t1